MNNKIKNRIKLIEAWQNGNYLDVAEEVEKMHVADLLEFLILFIKDNGFKEIEILKKFLE